MVVDSDGAIMKKLFLLIGLIGASFYTSADFSGSATLTNDYIWRGVSQGDGNAIQIGAEYETDFGAYAGVWASNVDFDEVTRETDYYAGISFPVWADHLNADVGYIDYRYDESGYDFEEWYSSVEFLDVGLELFYAQTTGENADEFANATWTIPFIDFVDVGVIYNYFEEDESQILYSLSKEFDRITVSLLSGEDFITKEDFVSVSFGISI